MLRSLTGLMDTPMPPPCPSTCILPKSDGRIPTQHFPSATKPLQHIPVASPRSSPPRAAQDSATRSKAHSREHCEGISGILGASDGNGVLLRCPRKSHRNALRCARTCDCAPLLIAISHRHPASEEGRAAYPRQSSGDWPRIDRTVIRNCLGRRLGGEFPTERAYMTFRRGEGIKKAPPRANGQRFCREPKILGNGVYPLSQNLWLFGRGVPFSVQSPLFARGVGFP
jgi:hypothetical protein